MNAAWRTLVVVLTGAAVLWVLSGGCAQLDAFGGMGSQSTVKEAVEKLKAGDDQAAMALLDKLVSRRGAGAESYVMAAAACQVARRFDLAAVYAQRGLSETPGANSETHARLHSILGSARQQLGDYDRAIESHLAARHLAPGDPAILNNLAYAYAEAPNGLERLRDAERLAQEAIEIAREKGAQPEEMAAYLDTLGWVQLKLGKTDLALVNLTAAADMVPDENDVLLHLARAYLALGRQKDAQILFERMLRSDPKDRRAKDALRELKALRGNESGAKRDALSEPGTEP